MSAITLTQIRDRNRQNLHTNNIGEMISNLRRARGWTQNHAAMVFQMARRKLIDIEANRIVLARYEIAGLLEILADPEASPD